MKEKLKFANAQQAKEILRFQNLKKKTAQNHSRHLVQQSL
jgi:hypothetical protein